MQSGFTGTLVCLPSSRAAEASPLTSSIPEAVVFAIVLSVCGNLQMMSMADGAVLSASFNEIFVLVQSTCGSPALFLPREASQGLLST